MKYALLERPEVQRELGLSATQIACLAAAYNAPDDQIAGLLEYQEMRRSLSAEERAATVEPSLVRLVQIMAEHLEVHLTEILTETRRARLGQLHLQMLGPALLLDDPSLAVQAGLTTVQAQAWRRIVGEYDRRLREDRHTYAGLCLQDQGLSPTAHARRLRSLKLRIAAALAERDNRLLEALEPTQRQRFRELQGNPLPLDWQDYGFFYTPFCDEPPAR